MNYTEIENYTVDKDTEYEETIINWRARRGKVQLKCPKCYRFFDLPPDITIDENGYCSDSVYHFCDVTYMDLEREEGWTVLAQLVGYNE